MPQLDQQIIQVQQGQPGQFSAPQLNFQAGALGSGLANIFKAREDPRQANDLANEFARTLRESNNSLKTTKLNPAKKLNEASDFIAASEKNHNFILQKFRDRADKLGIGLAFEKLAQPTFAKVLDDNIVHAEGLDKANSTVAVQGAIADSLTFIEENVEFTADADSFLNEFEIGPKDAQSLELTEFSHVPSPEVKTTTNFSVANTREAALQIQQASELIFKEVMQQTGDPSKAQAALKGFRAELQEKAFEKLLQEAPESFIVHNGHATKELNIIGPESFDADGNVTFTQLTLEGKSLEAFQARASQLIAQRERLADSNKAARKLIADKQQDDAIWKTLSFADETKDPGTILEELSTVAGLNKYGVTTETAVKLRPMLESLGKGLGVRTNDITIVGPVMAKLRLGESIDKDEFADALAAATEETQTTMVSLFGQNNERTQTKHQKFTKRQVDVIEALMGKVALTNTLGGNTSKVNAITALAVESLLNRTDLLDRNDSNWEVKVAEATTEVMIQTLTNIRAEDISNLALSKLKVPGTSLSLSGGKNYEFASEVISDFMSNDISSMDAALEIRRISLLEVLKKTKPGNIIEGGAGAGGVTGEALKTLAKDLILKGRLPLVSKFIQDIKPSNTPKLSTEEMAKEENKEAAQQQLNDELQKKLRPLTPAESQQFLRKKRILIPDGK